MPGTRITSRPFGKDPRTGAPVQLYSLYAGPTLVAEVMTYGATLLSYYAPTLRGGASKDDDILIGFDSLLPYTRPGHPYYGCTVGRCCNRIAEGTFKLNKETYKLAVNNGPNHLHGGIEAFHRKVWAATVSQDKLVMKCESEDGEEGYPGKLLVTATFAVSRTPGGHHRLVLTHSAELAPGQTKSTVVNLTNHCYFNLAGAPKSTLPSSGSKHMDVLDHRLALRATHFLPTTSVAIPTGEFRPCTAEDPFDFYRDYFNACETYNYDASQDSIAPRLIAGYEKGKKRFGRRIGDDIDNKKSSEQIAFGKGYDHTWALEKGRGGSKQPYITAANDSPALSAQPELGAIATCSVTPQHTRFLAMYTTQPGVQLYTGNWLPGDIAGLPRESKEEHVANRKGPDYPCRAGFCLETQHYPNSPNMPRFPTITLLPGKRFEAMTVFEVGTLLNATSML